MTNAVTKIRTSQAYHWLDYRNYQGLARTLHSVGLLIMAGLILFSAISPLVDIYVTHKYYSLNAQTSKLVGNVSDTLAKQITYDNTKNAYVFNAAGMTPTTQTVGPDKVPLALLQAKVAGNKSKSKSLYAVTMPTDPKAGITYYDSNTGLSFSMVPNFTQMSAKQIDNHVVYPINKDMQMVYSVKNNGLKEDIIMKKYTVDSFSYSYSLKLPNTMEARMLDDGSNELGIYSADPSLFNGSSSLGEDTAKIESAKLHAKKDHLVFAIPAPVIKGTGGRGQGTASASFALSNDNSTLTVSADHLKNLHYPVSVDPTVVITSTTDFSAGNNEDNNITYPANQINGGALTGGSISGGWTATSSLLNPTPSATSVTYNGYVYEIGGDNGAAYSTAVSYAVINANGTLGSWTATTSLPVGTDQATSVAYNGYVYEIGGVNTGGATTTSVYYAPINANGTLGSWTSTTALPTATKAATSVVYNGYVYEIGGVTSAVIANVYYAPINANGTIGSWTATTSLSTATEVSGSVVYNGYVYEVGGYTSALTVLVSYAPINANGTIGTWISATALPVAIGYASVVVYNGFLYQIGGNNGSNVNTVYYSQINANGSIGSWATSTVLPAATIYATSIAYNGYIYEIGGKNPSDTATVIYAKIDPAGTTTSYSTTTVLPAATYGATSVAYNGYVYEIGGCTTSCAVASVYYAPINANGTIGAWTSTTALLAATYYAASVAYNGYLYEIGGYNNSSAIVTTVAYAPINANGTIGSWTATTALPVATTDAPAVVYNGYIYEVGGQTGTPTANVYYAPINSNGTIGSWTATTSLPAAVYYSTSVVYDGYIYDIGGYNGGTQTAVNYAPINTNGTIGSWTATTSLTTGTWGATSVVYNGYIYEIGGQTSGVVTTVLYSAINSNGTIGAWVTNTSLTSGTWLATSVVYNGYIYEIGVANTTAVNYAFINNGGPGTVGAWTATTVLPAATYAATSVAYNGYLYEIGGIITGTTYVTTVSYAPINTNGTIGSWTATTSLPVTTGYATSVAYNGYIYEIGGNNGSVNINTVLYAPINANGTIGSWSTTTSIPAPTYNATSAVYNGYIYEIGGSAPGYTANVSYAPINSNGTLGSWASTTSLPVAEAAATSVAYNGYIYEISGTTGTSLYTVLYAPINANGTLGSWVATTSLPISPTQATSVAYNGYLYEFGGVNISSTYFAPINANGTIGSWTPATVLPTVTAYSSAVAYNGYVYQVGGCSGSCAISTVNYAPLNVMPRAGHYSKLFNFGTSVSPVSITYNGKLSNTNGLSSIQYKTADSNGVFGTTAYSTALSGSTTECVTTGTTQYVYTSITLDDSASASFPDINAITSNVTDFTVTMTSYHPSPSTRLRGGKFFNQENLQALDTCATYATVTGGTLTYDSTYFYRTFTGSGTLGITGGTLMADVLVIAGGGGGGGSSNTAFYAGGGGAGGLLSFTGQSLTSASYAVTVGGGGAGGAYPSGTQGTNGGDSQFGALTLVKGGGGGGGGGDQYIGFLPGKTGGSGGGGNSTSGAGGSATSGQGNAGATGGGTWQITPQSGGGGGGAGSVGGTPADNVHGGNGGTGSSSFSSWGLATSTGQNVSGTYYYAGGAGGNGNVGGGAAGAGGGAAGGISGTGGGVGTANTGGGGGATSAGGSGIVIVRYLKVASAPWQVNGAGGSADGVAVTTIPSTNLCSAGTASAVSGTGPWTWTCTGTNGGTTYYAKAPLNIMTNGGMETWSAGTSGFPPDNWVDPGADTLSREASIIHEGLYSMKAVWLSSFPQINQLPNLAGNPSWLGKTFTAQVWVYDNTATGTNTELRAWDCVSGGLIGNKFHSSATGWELLKITAFTLPTTATCIRIGVGIYGSSTVYIDDARVWQP